MSILFDQIRNMLGQLRRVVLVGEWISVKAGVDFFTGIRLFRHGIKHYMNLLWYGIKCRLTTKRVGFISTLYAINPLIFLLEKRPPTDDERDCLIQLVGFIETGFKNGMSEQEIIYLAKQISNYDLTHDALLYIVSIGAHYNIIDLQYIPLNLLPVEEPLTVTGQLSSLGTMENSGSADDVVEVSPGLYQFIVDHSVMLLTGLALTCIGILLYIFRPRPPSSSEPSEETVPNAGETVGQTAGQTAVQTTRVEFRAALKYLITLYASWILFIRSLFIKERPWIIPVLIIIAHANLYSKIFPSYEITSITNFFLWLGIYCISIDNIGSLISTYALSSTSNLFDQVVPFLTDRRNNTFTDFYKSSGMAALIIGKTAMTATGRAALGVGIISGTGYLINAHLERTHKAAENVKNRAAASEEARRQREAASEEARRQREFASNESQKQRDWQDKKDSQRSYESSWNPFKKPPKS